MKFLANDCKEVASDLLGRWPKTETKLWFPKMGRYSPNTSIHVLVLVWTQGLSTSGCRFRKEILLIHKQGFEGRNPVSHINASFPCSLAPLPVVPVGCSAVVKQKSICFLGECMSLWFHQFYLKESEIEREKNSVEKEELTVAGKVGREAFLSCPACSLHQGLDALGAVRCFIPQTRTRKTDRTAQPEWLRG